MISKGTLAAAGLCLLTLSAARASDVPSPLPLPTPLPPHTSMGNVLAQEIKFGAGPTPTPTMPRIVTSEGNLLPTPLVRTRLPEGWDKPKPKPTPNPEDAVAEEPLKAEDPDTVVLEKKTVLGEKDQRLQAQKNELERRQQWSQDELDKIEDSVLDQILNNPAFSFLGPYSAENRAREAKARLNEMDIEQRLLVLIEATKDPAQRAELERFLVEIRYGLSMSK